MTRSSTLLAASPEPTSEAAPEGSPAPETEPEEGQVQAQEQGQGPDRAQEPDPADDQEAAHGRTPPPTPAEAFDALYAHAAPALVQQTYLLTGRRMLSREAVERAFHHAWQHWPEVACDRDPAGWVRAVAYDYALSPWHRLRRAHRHRDTPPVERDRRALLDALLALPPPYRRTLLLYDGLGLDLPETAAETEASTPAAAHRLLHAREAIAARLPELADAGVLQERLTALTGSGPAMALSPARAVRAGGERRARLWTRAAVAAMTLLIGATAVTAVTAPGEYRAPVAPGHQVGGVPPAAGPEQLSEEAEALRDWLRSGPAAGPDRLLPQPR